MRNNLKTITKLSKTKRQIEKEHQEYIKKHEENIAIYLAEKTLIRTKLKFKNLRYDPVSKRVLTETLYSVRQK